MFEIKEELPSLYDILTSKIFNIDLFRSYADEHNLNAYIITEEYLTLNNVSEDDVLQKILFNSPFTFAAADLIILWRHNITIKILKNRFF